MNNFDCTTQRASASLEARLEQQSCDPTQVLLFSTLINKYYTMNNFDCTTQRASASLEACLEQQSCDPTQVLLFSTLINKYYTN